MEGILGQQAGEADTGITTLSTTNGKKIVGKLEGGEREEVLVAPFRMLGTPTANETFDAELEKETNAWAEANVMCVRKEDRGSDILQGESSQEKKQRSV